MLSGSGDGDNSILCLTYLAGSINRIVAKLQRERILSAIKLTEKIERDPSNIDNFLQKKYRFYRYAVEENTGND